MLPTMPLSEEQVAPFETKLCGYFFRAEATFSPLKSGGTMINTGSITCLLGLLILIDYMATKPVIHAFTKKGRTSVTWLRWAVPDSRKGSRPRIGVLLMTY